MKKFDVTVSYEMYGKNSFGETETLIGSQTESVKADNKTVAEKGVRFTFEQSGHVVTKVSACERP